MKRTEVEGLARVHKHHRPRTPLVVGKDLFAALMESPGFDDLFAYDAEDESPSKIFVIPSDTPEKWHVALIQRPMWAGGNSFWEYLVPATSEHWVRAVMKWYPAKVQTGARAIVRGDNEWIVMRPEEFESRYEVNS